MYITWAYLHLIRGFQTACVHICLVTSVMVNFRGLGGFCLHYRFFLDLPGPPECFCKELRTQNRGFFSGFIALYNCPAVGKCHCLFSWIPRLSSMEHATARPARRRWSFSILAVGWFWFCHQYPPNKDAMMLPQQTRDVHPVLVWCWATVANSGPASCQNSAYIRFDLGPTTSQRWGNGLLPATRTTTFKLTLHICTPCCMSEHQLITAMLSENLWLWICHVGVPTFILWWFQW